MASQIQAQAIDSRHSHKQSHDLACNKDKCDLDNKAAGAIDSADYLTGDCKVE